MIISEKVVASILVASLPAFTFSSNKMSSYFADRRCSRAKAYC
jgi:hypothetical protein